MICAEVYQMHVPFALLNYQKYIYIFLEWLVCTVATGLQMFEVWPKKDCTLEQTSVTTLIYSGMKVECVTIFKETVILI